MSEDAVAEIALDAIRTDGATQAREQLDFLTVDSYASAMFDGAVFPPVVVYEENDETLWLADGFHRVAAAKQNAKETIQAEVRQGGQRDALLYAVGANATHGLRRTNADKRKAVLLLLRDEEWRQWSDREIARRCYVDHKLVGKLRAEFTGDIPSEERVYLTKHGTKTTMKTAKHSASARIAPEVRAAIKDLPLADNQAELCRLARLDNEQQRAVVGLVVELPHNDGLDRRGPPRWCGRSSSSLGPQRIPPHYRPLPGVWS